MYPKMIGEVIEAIETHFDDEPEIIVDCMRYLLNALAREQDVARVGQWLEDHDRCCVCGTKLEVECYREPHPEIGVGVYETLYSSYCPHCDRGEPLYE